MENYRVSIGVRIVGYYETKEEAFEVAAYLQNNGEVAVTVAKKDSDGNWIIL